MKNPDQELIAAAHAVARPKTSPAAAATRTRLQPSRGLPIRDEGWMFPSGAGTLQVASSPTKVLKNALAEAGITRRFTVHGLRRTWNNLLRQAADGQMVRAITGHVTEQMTEHYSHIEVAEKAEATSRVLQLLSATKSMTSSMTLGSNP